MSNQQHRVMLNTNTGRYGHLYGGLSIGELQQAKADMASLEGYDRAKAKQFADDRLITDLALTGLGLLKTSREPKAKELVTFLESKGLDNSSLTLAKQYINDHLSNDPTALKALDYMHTADRVNTYGTTDNVATDSSNYQRVQGHVDEFTGHKTFTYETNKDGQGDMSAFATQKNKQFDDLAKHFDIIEE